VFVEKGRERVERNAGNVRNGKTKVLSWAKLPKIHKFQKLAFKRVDLDKFLRKKISSGTVRRSGRGENIRNDKQGENLKWRFLWPLLIESGHQPRQRMGKLF